VRGDAEAGSLAATQITCRAVPGRSYPWRPSAAGMTRAVRGSGLALAAMPTSVMLSVAWAGRAERELGVTFRSLAQTIADEAAWYRHHGMLPPDLPLAAAPTVHPEGLKARRG